MLRVHIDAKPDHVLRLAKRHDPYGAVAEMIWNALDAEATHVDVEVQNNDIGGVERVIVRDDGHGMPAASCGSHFGDLGGSWKATAKVSPNLRRTLHGRSGKGRLRAFALGQLVRWTTVAESLTGGHEKTVITGDASTPADFQIDGPDVTNEPAGTVVDTRLPAEHVDRLSSDMARPKITAEFALFLTLHPEVSVIYRGEALDPAHAQIYSADYLLGTVDGVTGEPPTLRVIEWPNDPGRLLALCDHDGVMLGSVPPAIQAPGHHFTAYVMWDGFKDQMEQLALAEWDDTTLMPVIEAAREQLRVHFRDELFHLTRADREDLKRLLDRTSLASLVRASTEVTNRLDFLAALKLMVFDPEVSGKVKERAELHRILEREQWVFGERYHLMVSDQSLDTVLKRHLTALGRDTATLDLEPVRREDGSVGIIDLMLGQASRGSRGREHLVIELKAPKVPIGHKEVGQIKSYAQAVVDDPQFADTEVQWDFWIVSTEMDDVVRRDASQPHEPPGRIANWGSARVWAKTWSEIVEDCETRLHYYRDRLDHDPAAKHASEYLQRMHGQRTPKPLRQP